MEKDLEGYGMFDTLSDYGFYEQGLVQQPVCGLNRIAPFLKAKAVKGPEKLWGYYRAGQPEKVTNRFIVQPGYHTREFLGLRCTNMSWPVSCSGATPTTTTQPFLCTPLIPTAVQTRTELSRQAIPSSSTRKDRRSGGESASHAHG